MSDETTRARLPPWASLAALGQILHQRDRFGPIRDLVKIAQKTVKHSPTDTRSDAWMAILRGAHGLVEGNARVRAALALQRAFGRQAGAEQSVIQETLDVCSEANVREGQQALTTISRTPSQGYPHDSRAAWHGLDVDMRGLPGGPKAAFATKGDFAKQRNRRGRQRGRGLATL